MMSAFMFPIHLATNKIKRHRESEGEQKAQQKTEKLGTKRGPCKALNIEREAKLTHSNLQISKSLYIIIRSCNLYEC